MNDAEIPLQTTPRELSPEILEFCREIDATAKPIYIAVKPDRNCIPAECYQNVANKIRNANGKEQQGRIIWEAPGVHLEAEHHVIWISPTADAIDITPKEDREERILFLPSSKKLYDGSKLIAPIYKLLSDDPMYQKHTKLAVENFKEKSRLFKQGLLVKPPAWKEDMASIKVGRNDPCPCGSGRKYKHCCLNSPPTT